MPLWTGSVRRLGPLGQTVLIQSWIWPACQHRLARTSGSDRGKPSTLQFPASTPPRHPRVGTAGPADRDHDAARAPAGRGASAGQGVGARERAEIVHSCGDGRGDGGGSGDGDRGTVPHGTVQSSVASRTRRRGAGVGRSQASETDRDEQASHTESLRRTLDEELERRKAARGAVPLCHARARALSYGPPVSFRLSYVFGGAYRTALDSRRRTRRGLTSSLLRGVAARPPPPRPGRCRPADRPPGRARERGRAPPPPH